MVRKGSARENILMLLAMSDGQIKKDICREICGSEYYYKRVMQRMKEEGSAATLFGEKPKMLRIRRRGIEVVKERIPWIEERYNQGRLNIKKDRIQRQADVSQVIYNMQLADVLYCPDEKASLKPGGMTEEVQDAGLYYTAWELNKSNNDETRGSRVCGVLYMRGDMYFLYNMEDRNIKFYKKTEQRLQDSILLDYPPFNGRKRPMAIIFGEGYRGMEIILENVEREKKFRMMNHNEFYNRLTPEEGYYYVPNGQKGSLYIRIIRNPQITENIKKNIQNKLGSEVLMFFPIHLPVLKMLYAGDRRMNVVCLEDQAEFVKSYFSDKVNLYTLERNAVERLYEGK